MRSGSLHKNNANGGGCGKLRQSKPIQIERSINLTNISEMDFEKELFELQEYCKASANFISDNDSIEDRYARQAYKDVAGKIALVFQRALAKNTPTSEEQLAALAVVKSVCVRCGKPIDNFDKDSNNSCDECWLSI